MMFLMQLVFMIIKFIHAVGYLSWKYRMFIIRVVQTLYDPLDSSCLNLKQPTVASAIRPVLLWWISSYIMSGHTYAFHYLYVQSVVSLILPNHIYEGTLPSSTEGRAQLNNLFLSIIISKIRMLLYDSTDVTLCTTIFYL